MAFKWEGKIPFLRKVVVAGGIAILLAVLATLPRLGYFGEAVAVPVEKDPQGFWLVDIDCNMSYNPFVYPFSWVSGRGQFSVSFSIVSVPQYIGSDFKFPKWRNTEELAEEGVITLLLNDIPINLLPNFIILIGIELAKVRELYVCLAGGVFAFPFGGPIASFVGFFSGVLAIFFIFPRLRKSGRLSKILGIEEDTVGTQSY